MIMLSCGDYKLATLFAMLWSDSTMISGWKTGIEWSLFSANICLPLKYLE